MEGVIRFLLSCFVLRYLLGFCSWIPARERGDSGGLNSTHCACLLACLLACLPARTPLSYDYSLQTGWIYLSTQAHVCLYL
jgi:hypothetical protein